MSSDAPKPISRAENARRVARCRVIARSLGFVGRIEYRHRLSQSGGAQYELGSNPHEDALTVFSEAFDRDSDPEDFTLEAIIAHERGHQIFARNPSLSKRMKTTSELAEEVV